jgi:hypothetical protein
MGIIMRELTGDNRFLSAAEEGSIGGSLFKKQVDRLKTKG